MINVRVAASRLKIAEVCSYEARRIHGVSNLNAVKDGIRVLRTIRREFVQSRRRDVTTSHAGIPRRLATTSPRNPDRLPRHRHGELR